MTDVVIGKRKLQRTNRLAFLPNVMTCYYCITVFFFLFFHSYQLFFLYVTTVFSTMSCSCIMYSFANNFTSKYVSVFIVGLQLCLNDFRFTRAVNFSRIRTLFSDKNVTTISTKFSCLFCFASMFP